MSDLQPRSAAAALRLLADEIQKGNSGPYAVTYLNTDGKIATAYHTADQPFLLVGMVEDIKMSVMGTIKHAEMP